MSSKPKRAHTRRQGDGRETAPHHRAKKSLGQHFLISPTVLHTILHAAALTEHDTVLEIGPGKGVLTKRLLEFATHVIAVEKDEHLVALLSARYAKEIKSGTLTLLSADVLLLTLSEHVPTHYTVVANLPYYITGAFMRLLFSSTRLPTRAVLMVQKEVGERIVARNGTQSVLSIAASSYGTPRYVATVRPSAFRPAPKVSSAVVCIDTICRDFFFDVGEEHFFHIVKCGFAHKRKKLAGNLALHYGSLHTINEALRACNIPEDIRAERLSKENWKCLAKKLSRAGV